MKVRSSVKTDLRKKCKNHQEKKDVSELSVRIRSTNRDRDNLLHIMN